MMKEAAEMQQRIELREPPVEEEPKVKKAKKKRGFKL